MFQVNGKAAFRGIAIGPIKELSKNNIAVKQYQVEDVEAEYKRFEEAKVIAVRQLAELYEKALKEVGEEEAAVFEVHQMMTEDEDYSDSVRSIICDQKLNAEFAVEMAGNNFSAVFEEMDDDYMKERAVDVKDISERLIRILSGQEEKKEEVTDNMIILADDLAPSETIQLNREKVLAFVTRKGSTNSHTAILARTMNIPALVLTPVEGSVNGKMAIVDGEQGVIIIDPDPIVLSEYEEKLEEQKKRQEQLLQLKGKEAVTKSGRKINLYANIGGVEDMDAVLANGAEGIGLFRSEFLYLQNKDYPTEEEQFRAYKSVAEKMEGKKVVVRTLDIGADKKVDYFNLAEEENPALGYRAVRICLDRTGIFKTQLRALYRASAFGRLAIMVPMITDSWEIREVKRLIEEVKEELTQEGIAFGNVEFGVMIETPAAVMVADELAKEVEFFSIGTNDLTQYTLAIDRQNEQLARFFNAHHPAVLKMIQMVIDSGHNAGIWVGICGELGADLSLTEQFVKMGIDELSVSPVMILPVCRKIREID